MLTSFPNFLNKGEKIDMLELLKRIVTIKRKVIAFPFISIGLIMVVRKIFKKHILLGKK